MSNLLFLPDEERVGHVQVLYQWISAGSFKLNLAILVDPLSVFMFLIVTGVGFVIHVYSLGYMHDDPELLPIFRIFKLIYFLDVGSGCGGRFLFSVLSVGL